MGWSSTCNAVQTCERGSLLSRGRTHAAAGIGCWQLTFNVHSKGISCNSFHVALSRLALAHLQWSNSGLEMRMDAQWLYKADEPGVWAALGRLRCHLLVIPSEPGDGAAQVREHVL